ncbi:hypothetical protein [Microlunatus antarcticus]
MASTVAEPRRTDATEPPPGWVPVDRRWHGLDRSSFRYALPVLALAILLAVVVPRIDAAVPGGSLVVAGERVGLREGVAFTPAVGWTLRDGYVLGSPDRNGGYPAAAEVVRDAVAFSVNTTKWSGTAGELFTQFESTTDAEGDGRSLHVVGDPQPFTTTAGQSGVVGRYRSTTTDGLAATLVLNGTGVLVQVTGPTGVVQTPSGDIAAMLTSFASTAGEQQ